MLGSLQKDNSVINLYDIQHTIIGNEEIEPSVLERVVDPKSPHNIMSFSWHSSDENRFLTIALSGKLLSILSNPFDRSMVSSHFHFNIHFVKELVNVAVFLLKQFFISCILFFYWWSFEKLL